MLCDVILQPYNIGIEYAVAQGHHAATALLAGALRRGGRVPAARDESHLEGLRLERIYNRLLRHVVDSESRKELQQKLRNYSRIIAGLRLARLVDAHVELHLISYSMFISLK